MMDSAIATAKFKTGKFFHAPSWVSGLIKKPLGIWQ